MAHLGLDVIDIIWCLRGAASRRQGGLDDLTREGRVFVIFRDAENAVQADGYVASREWFVGERITGERRLCRRYFKFCI